MGHTDKNNIFVSSSICKAPIKRVLKVEISFDYPFTEGASTDAKSSGKL